MTKYPKAVWVGFDGEMNPINVVCDKRNYRLCYRLARYHLRPGYEVARANSRVAHALNILSMQGHIIGSTPGYIAERLRKGGFRVRWDAKAGKFKESK